jgi:hypothetical protein
MAQQTDLGDERGMVGLRSGVPKRRLIRGSLRSLM